MAAKGANAKIEVENIIRNAFGKNFLGISDKKIYVNADDGNGEMVNIAITLTCPKVTFTAISGENDGIDFDNMPEGGAPTEFKPAEITTEENENIRKMLAELGL